MHKTRVTDSLGFVSSVIQNLSELNLKSALIPSESESELKFVLNIFITIEVMSKKDLKEVYASTQRIINFIVLQIFTELKFLKHKT